MAIEWCRSCSAKTGCVVALLVALAATPLAARDESENSIDIPDAALRKVVEEALGKEPGDPINHDEMATLEYLDGSESGVRQLTGIEYATNLDTLLLAKNEVVDLGPLADLASLTLLDLRGNALADCVALSGLQSLTWLVLSENMIVDLLPLADMVSLKYLYLGGNEIAELNALAGMTSLTSLGLSNNAIADVSALAGMTSLTSLSLSNNAIADVSALAGMTSLTWLGLSGNTIMDVSPLSVLTSLEELDLSWNDITDLSPLAGMTSLTWLVLSGNTIMDVSPLSDLTSLKGLRLRSNQIAEVSPLSGLTSLASLDLLANEIIDVSPLSGLTSLNALDLSANKVADVSPLSKLTALTSLHLSQSQIVDADLSALSDMTSLTVLGLNGNTIMDVSPLAVLISLEWLDLSWNDITDLSPLSNLTSLKGLHLWSNQIVDLSPLSGLTSLASLGLIGNEITDLSPLSGLTFLRALDVGGNKIADVSALSGLTSLEVLDLSGNEVFDLLPLASLAALTDLELRGNQVVDLRPLVDLTSLTDLDLRGNEISDVSPLVANNGLGQGSSLILRENPLARESRETHIPTLLRRGVQVEYDAFTELPEIPDAGLRQAAERAVYASRREVDFATLSVLEAVDQGVEHLTGLGVARDLRGVFLDRNKITDIAPLSGLGSLRALTLAHNMVEDFTSLVDMESLRYLALDGNSLQEIPSLPPRLSYLYLSDNSISDITPLADSWYMRELDISGNSITSLPSLGGLRSLQYLHVHDNQVADISPLSFDSLREVHLRNNAVRDISPLLQGEQLLMADVRRNPLADDALAVLDALRERRVTVLAGETVPYFPAAGGDGRQGFLRIVNRGDEDGHVFIEAVDDAGVPSGPVRLEVSARGAVHLNSADLENGNAGKDLEGVGRPTAGDWRLSVISALDVEVLSYIRTDDGFVTAMHDVVPDAMAPFFNPGSNTRQRSILRVVNTEADWAKWATGGYDDRGIWHSMAGSMLVRPQQALTLTAQALEDAHGLGDGAGKWRLRVRGFPWFAMSLLESPTGHLANLSTAPDNATPLADGATMYRLPLFPASGGLREGFARVINRSYVSGMVAIEAVDDDGDRFGPLELALRPRRAVHFNSTDLEVGSAAKGWGGVGVGEGDWRLEATSELDLMVLGYARTADGFVTSLHDLAPVAEEGGHRVVFFNPGSNTRQVSRLRLINDGGRAASVTVTGIDDRGNGSGTVALTVPAGSALAYTSAELEAGGGLLAGGLGDGDGKWRLRVRSDVPIAVMSLLETPSGHLTNVSTGTAD